MGAPDLTNLAVVLEVPMRLSVELPSSQKSAEDVLGYQVGSVIELDALASDPVILSLNGKPLARGTVFLSEERLAVTVTELKK